jgi:hypothetical protein
VLESVKTFFDILVSVSSLAAVLAAAWWFLYTTQFKPRLQFDLDCRFIACEETQSRLAELHFIFENKGFVEHRLYDLNVAVHTLDRAGSLESRETGEVIFPVRLLSRTSIVPREYGYYFVRPGVKQIITHTISIPSDISVVRVTSSFLYGRDKDFPHTARRVFPVDVARSSQPLKSAAAKR